MPMTNKLWVILECPEAPSSGVTGFGGLRGLHARLKN